MGRFRAGLWLLRSAAFHSRLSGIFRLESVVVHAPGGGVPEPRRAGLTSLFYNTPSAFPGDNAPMRPGFHSISPYLIARDASAAIEFYKQAFGATELMRVPSPEPGKLMHAELQIGDSQIM